MPCINCGRGYHDECLNINCTDCHPDVEKLAQSFGLGGAPIKEPEDVKDPHSTGRKRAAIQYPLFKGEFCEWKGKKNCGGGRYPIVGCIDGKQTNRHHGPVKNTLRNEPGNVHRICATCHNRWHAKNDPGYDETEYNTLPHKPEEATEMELIHNEAQWRMGLI